MPTLHLIIKGKVQGVFFRATAREVAEELQVKGWIRNTEEGNVEAIVSGSDEQLQKFTTWCKKGPERAIVTDVIISKIEEQHFSEFKVIRGS
jgi:acylphosphatase